MSTYKQPVFGGKLLTSFSLQFSSKLMTLPLLLQAGRSVAFPGHPLGSGLTPAAAKARNLVVKNSH